MASAASGLGSSIVEALAKRLNATVETHGANPGTIVSIGHVEANAGLSNDTKVASTGLADVIN
jgi:hypothetical protein